MPDTRKWDVYFEKKDAETHTVAEGPNKTAAKKAARAIIAERGDGTGWKAVKVTEILEP